MIKVNLQPYLKAIMAVLGVVMTSMSAEYGGTHWFPIVTSAVTAISVYLVPNSPKQ